MTRKPRMSWLSGLSAVALFAMLGSMAFGKGEVTKTAWDVEAGASGTLTVDGYCPDNNETQMVTVMVVIKDQNGQTVGGGAGGDYGNYTTFVCGVPATSAGTTYTATVTVTQEVGPGDTTKTSTKVH
jgi:hypothetical protein